MDSSCSWQSFSLLLLVVGSVVLVVGCEDFRLLELGLRPWALSCVKLVVDFSLLLRRFLMRSFVAGSRLVVSM